MVGWYFKRIITAKFKSLTTIIMSADSHLKEILFFINIWEFFKQLFVIRINSQISDKIWRRTSAWRGMVGTWLPDCHSTWRSAPRCQRDQMSSSYWWEETPALPFPSPELQTQWKNVGLVFVIIRLGNHDDEKDAMKSTIHSWLITHI